MTSFLKFSEAMGIFVEKANILEFFDELRILLSSYPQESIYQQLKHSNANKTMLNVVACQMIRRQQCRGPGTGGKDDSRLSNSNTI